MSSLHSRVVVFMLHAFWFLPRAPMPEGSVVIGSSPHLPGALAARIAASVRRVPFVLEVRDLWPESLAVGGVERGLMYRVLRLAADLLYRWSDAIVVLAPGSTQAIVDRGGDADMITFIPAGVDPSVFESALPRRPSEVPTGVPLLVYAGAHGPANDLATVLRAMAVLRDREGDAHRILVGDGPDKPVLRRLAAELALENVTFLDPVAKSAVPALLTSCDVGIMALADVELFQRAVSPNKLFGYLSAGLRVVTDVPGEVAAMVAASEVGVACPPAYPAGLAAAIEAALALSPCDSGQRWVAAEHGRSVLVARLAEVLASVRR
jgi:glycosyltransferase involved in cell wall biosynthesis